jgi:hypothetical protein
VIETKKPALLHNQKFYIFDSKDLPFDQVEDLICEAGGEVSVLKVEIQLDHLIGIDFMGLVG